MPTIRTRLHKPRTTRKSTKRPRPLTEKQVAAAVATLGEPAGTARFAAGKALCVTAEADPARVYPHVDAIVPLMRSDSKIVRWTAIRLLGALAPADGACRLETILGEYLAIIHSGDLISAVNVIQGAVRIAKSRPDLRDRILGQLLSVERATYKSAECRNVAIQKTLEALLELGPVVCGQRDVAAFVDRQRANPRAAAARCAAKIQALTSISRADAS